MDNQQQRIDLFRQMISEKVEERSILQSLIEESQVKLKQTDAAIFTYQFELEKMTGEKIEVSQTLLRGAEIGIAAVEALERLGGAAHYLKIKEEIETLYSISGATDKSKSDSVWNHLNKSSDVKLVGSGEFKLQTEITSEDKKAICRKYGLNPDIKSRWDLGILWESHGGLSTKELTDFIDEMTQISGKDWLKYYRKAIKQGGHTPRI